MDHTLLVSGLESFGHLSPDLHHLRDRHRATGDPIGEVLPGDQLHCDEPRAAGLVQAIDSSDIRMVQGGEQASLPFETPQAFGVGTDAFGQDLDRDLPVEVRVDPLLDDAHPALADLLDDAVVTEGATDEVLHCLDSLRAYVIAVTSRLGGNRTPAKSVRSSR